MAVWDGIAPTATPTATPTPPPSFPALHELIEAQAFARGLETSLTAKVNTAEKLAERGSPCVSVNVLGAFINEVQAQGGKRIADSTADDLIALANDLIADLLDGVTCSPDPDTEGDVMGDSAEVTVGTDPVAVDSVGDRSAGRPDR